MANYGFTERGRAIVAASNRRRAADLEGIAKTADKLRGFHVPADKLLEYRRLTKVKMFPAREAAKILGLEA
jgi:hypothetical protein